MFEKIKKFFGKEEIKVLPEVKNSTSEKKPKKPRKPKTQDLPSDKELATQKGEPYVNIIKVDIDPNDVNNGAFELDWNDKFVLNLVRAGYKIRGDDTDQQIVDRWFQTVCRNVALEVYEQEAADPEKRDDIRVIRQKDIGNGRTEVS
jgi:hypothetical protein